mmetsp:Transcript_62669/g.167969  ORF Transcript_62669/g.167969 Transcript_62669/m.167969 type:complete len:126 (+) Transcript_62669:6-383(+)
MNPQALLRLGAAHSRVGGRMLPAFASRRMAAAASPVNVDIKIGSRIPEGLQYKLSSGNTFDFGEVVVLNKGAGKYVFAKVLSFEGGKSQRHSLGFTGQAEYEVSVDGGSTTTHQPGCDLGKIGMQ